MNSIPSSICGSTPSENLVAHDEFLRGTVSRTLFYNPSSNSITSWQPHPKPFAHFEVRIREGDVAFETNNSEHPRFNFTNIVFLLDTCSFNCSNSVVKPFSVDNICNYSTNDQRKMCFTNNDQTIFASTVNNIINTSRSNLVTRLTSSKVPFTQENILPIIILLPYPTSLPLAYFLTQ